MCNVKIFKVQLFSRVFQLMSKITMNIAPYGSWKSPITADMVTKAAPGLDQAQFDDEKLYWLEARPWESGRNVIMRRLEDGTIEDILPIPLSARSRIHEYGGAPYLVVDNIVYYCLDSDQRIYRINLNNKPVGDLNPDQSVALSPEGNWRYSDFTVDTTNNRLLAAAEKHSESTQQPQNFIVAIPLDGSQQITIVLQGSDFYSNARISPCGGFLSWLCWQHPNMPWDESELWVGALDDSGGVVDAKILAGAKLSGKPESIFQPRWHSNGDLYFASDRNNWWSFYRIELSGDGRTTAVIEHTESKQAEFAMPQWVFGMSTYDFIDNETIATIYTHKGFWYLATIEIESGKLNKIETPYTSMRSVACANGKTCLIGAAASIANELLVMESDAIECVYNNGELPVSLDNLSHPQVISFTTDDAIAHAFFYPPTNSDFSAPEETKPPLIVMCHGGPTAASDSSLSFKIQYWTSRGFAVMDVNYRGSTGYGREYRDALKGQWGVVDVNDAVNGASFLADKGFVDGTRMAIRGGSAGGFTVLSALTFHDVFKAGASLYGIGDLELLVAGTHKFEVHYTDSLIGPYPETKALYQQRSPINHIEGLTCPVIFLQGLDDKIVPPDQAQLMVNALTEKRIPVAYVPFEGEGHGFRKAENIKKALESELYFYSKVFGFELAETVGAVKISNLDS